MPVDIYGKTRVVLCWVASIAFSILCCAVLFVMLGRSVRELEQGLNDENAGIIAIEKEQMKMSEMMVNLSWKLRDEGRKEVQVKKETVHAPETEYDGLFFSTTRKAPITILIE
ncbi:MAG: hypothetical protein FWF23_04870 [Alphaproteobacteria bacterium]|nr:hypothetical protein [Alphaproteobacteria bacterium]MCL2505968.1 hypothetical protein [Alphaproteobacteria bacterium]